MPITRDPACFAEAASLGHRLIWLHTYAERSRGDEPGNEVPQGTARAIKGVSSDPARYPDTFGYDAARQEVTVAEGRFGPVSPEIWDYEISGLKVVQSWLAYRMAKRKGKASSDLDKIRPERWTARMSEEFLELLWVLEATLNMEPALEAMLDRVVSGPCFTKAELPMPTTEERKAPAGARNEPESQLSLPGADDDADE